MYTLFSMESKEDVDNELLIDKVIRKADQDKQGLRVTADLIKQRQRLTQEIDKELSQKGKPDSSDDSADKEDESTDTPEETDDTKDQEPSSDSEDKGDAADDKKKSSDEKEDAVESSQSEEDLEASIGSGHSEAKDTPTKDKEPVKDDDKEVAKESYSLSSVVTQTLFTGIKEKHLAYTLSLEQYNLSPKVGGPKEQPVAYVKQEVLESLHKVVKLANTYIQRNTLVAEKTHKALLSVSESLVVYSQCHEDDMLHLTLKVVSDEDKLKALCYPGQSDLKESSSTLLKYLKNTAGLTAMILENDLSSLSTSLTTHNYTKEGDTLVYQKVLPGFNQMKVACTDYRDYLTTKYQDYQAYRSPVYKVQELYDLSGITIANDNTLVAVLARLNEIVTQLGVMTDNLKDLSDKYAQLIEQVKSTCYDIENDKIKTLASLDIDSRLKDFIRFKVVSEVYTTGIDVATGYVVSMLSVLSELVEMDN